MPGRPRLAVLLAVHGAGVGALGLWCWSNGGRFPGFALDLMPVAVLLALALGQACLLGTWAAFSRASSRARLKGQIVGAVCLEVVLTYGSENGEFLFMASIATALVAAVLMAARYGRADVRRVPTESTGSASEGFRWSIRGLMLFTLAVALLIGAARGARESLGPRVPSILVSTVWSLSFVVQALGACWAALGLASPWSRCGALLVCATATGALFAYGFQASDDWKSLSYIMTVNVLQSAVVLGSLLVVRSAGYRLVRPGVLDPEPGGPASNAVPGEALVPEAASTG